MTDEATDLAARIRAADVPLDTTSRDLDPRATARSLDSVEFTVHSPCREVGVWMHANGRLSDVVIAEDAIERLGAERLSGVIQRTIGHAEQTMRDALRAVVERPKGDDRG